ncbi:hypothetical protein PAMC26577_10865 [Caballeronia sordidicola]|uniref:Uncharacterized protein n=1 Tax=Caballeronia sordidicola TaxID=196367 RepID=A0A242MYI4_CABSO|nr:hypothetical protein PAMC26577_10865 [Caballeronia sordidicola]
MTSPASTLDSLTPLGPAAPLLSTENRTSFDVELLKSLHALFL